MILYRKKIEEKDESFFLENNYTEIVNNTKSEGVEGIIQKLKISNILHLYFSCYENNQN